MLIVCKGWHPHTPKYRRKEDAHTKAQEMGHQMARETMNKINRLPHDWSSRIIK